MSQPFLDANRNLGRKSVSSAEDRCADDGGKPGVDQGLAADDHEAAEKLGIVTRMMNAINFASSHRLALAARYTSGAW